MNKIILKCDFTGYVGVLLRWFGSIVRRGEEGNRKARIATFLIPLAPLIPPSLRLPPSCSSRNFILPSLHSLFLVLLKVWRSTTLASFNPVQRHCSFLLSMAAGWSSQAPVASVNPPCIFVFLRRSPHEAPNSPRAHLFACNLLSMSQRMFVIHSHIIKLKQRSDTWVIPSTLWPSGKSMIPRLLLLSVESWNELDLEFH